MKNDEVLIQHLQGSHRKSQVVLQDWCVFHDQNTPQKVLKVFDLVQCVQNYEFLTRSTLPSWHTVIEHCTNYCVTLHVMYLL